MKQERCSVTYIVKLESKDNPQSNPHVRGSEVLGVLEQRF
jgi:hypothetical protein